LKILFRPCTLEEIFLFGVVDLNSDDDVMHKLDMLLENCTEITIRGKKTSYLDLYEKDKFIILYLIKEFTFINSKNYTINYQCDNIRCRKDLNIPYRATFSSKRNRTLYAKTLPHIILDVIDVDGVIKFYNDENVVVFKMRPPTLRVEKLLYNSLLEDSLKRILKFMFLNNDDVNEIKLEENINLLKEIDDLDLISAINEIINTFENSVYYEIRYVCDECKNLIVNPILIPNYKDLFSLFQGDFDKIVENEFELFYQNGLQPSELNNMFYFKYEKYIEALNVKIGEENKQREKENQQQESMNNMPNFNGMNNIANNFKNFNGYKR